MYDDFDFLHFWISMCKHTHPHPPDSQDEVAKAEAKAKAKQEQQRTQEQEMLPLFLETMWSVTLIDIENTVKVGGGGVTELGSLCGSHLLVCTR